MKKALPGIIIAVIAVAAIVGIVVANSSDDASPKSPVSSNTSNTDSGGDPSGNGAEDSEKADDGASSDPANTSSVTISDFSFSPATITVKKGTKVTWTNKDDVKHNIAPDTESADFTGSELLSEGESYSFTFNTVGTFAYHCTPHPYMKAKVIVTE